MTERAQPKLGILGGGQLGLMLWGAADSLPLELRVLDPDQNCACAAHHNVVSGDFTNAADVASFARDLDVLTIEIEKVSVAGLEQAQANGVRVHPAPETLRVIQDKLIQKQFLKDHGIDQPAFWEEQELSRSALEQRLPLVQKTRRGGYDGRGVRMVRSPAALDDDGTWALGSGDTYFEELVDLQAEYAVIVARQASGETISFRPVEMVFSADAHQLDYQLDVPLESGLGERLAQCALAAAEALDIVGVLAVEMFVTRDGQVLVNEVAPRPHNSGHHTINAYSASQYVQHLRAVLGWPLAASRCLSDSALVNVVGRADDGSDPALAAWSELLALDGVFPFSYGKRAGKPFRKLGHITVLGSGRAELAQRVQQVKALLAQEVRV